MMSMVEILRSTIEALVAERRAEFIDLHTRATGEPPPAELVDATVGPFLEPVATQALCAWAGAVFSSYERGDWTEIDALMAWLRDYQAALVDAGTIDLQRDVLGAYERIEVGTQIIEQRERASMSGQLSDAELAELVGKD